MKEFDPRTSPMSGDMSSDRTKDADGTHEESRTANEMRAVSERRAEPTVVVVEQKRKRYTAQQKLELVRLTYLPGNTVSSVARSYGIAPALLFRWRALDKQGGLRLLNPAKAPYRPSNMPKRWMRSNACKGFWGKWHQTMLCSKKPWRS